MTLSIITAIDFLIMSIAMSVLLYRTFRDNRLTKPKCRWLRIINSVLLIIVTILVWVDFGINIYKLIFGIFNDNIFVVIIDTIAAVIDAAYIVIVHQFDKSKTY